MKNPTLKLYENNRKDAACFLVGYTNHVWLMMIMIRLLRHFSYNTHKKKTSKGDDTSNVAQSNFSSQLTLFCVKQQLSSLIKQRLLRALQYYRLQGLCVCMCTCVSAYC